MKAAIRGKFDMFLTKRIKFIKIQRNKSLKGPKSIAGCDYNSFTSANIVYSYFVIRSFFLSSLSITLCILYASNLLNRENDANCATFIFCTRIYNHIHWIHFLPTVHCQPFIGSILWNWLPIVRTRRKKKYLDLDSEIIWTVDDK